jgi:hypothetical protein
MSDADEIPDAKTTGSKAPKRSDHIRVWLAEAKHRQALWGFGFGAAAAVAAIVAAYLTYNAMWFLLVFFFGGSLLGSGTTWTAAALTLGLFAINATTNRPHLENLQFERNPQLRLAYRVAPLFDAGWVALVNKRNFESFVKLISLCLLAWPQLATGAWRMVGKGMRLRAMDVAGPSKVLSHLLTQERKFTLDELAEKFAKLDMRLALVPLFDVDGVLFRSTPPIGFSLEEDLRRELAEYLASRMG